MSLEANRSAVRPTLRMVADMAGVSIATASYVLSGRARSQRGAGASVETQQRVRAAAERLDFVPNQAARGMRTGTTKLVQLSLSMLSDPWALAVAEAANRAGRVHDLETMIFADGDWFRALERRPNDVAFIDAIDDTSASREKLASLSRRGQKLVVFSDTLEPEGFDVIRSDAISGAYLAMEHLVAARSDIACLTSVTISTSPEPSRLTAYRELMERNNLEMRSDRVGVYLGGQTSAFAAAMQLLDRTDPPSAIYATTDFAAIAAIHAAHRLGLQVPVDVAIIGLGNTPDGELTSPRLSTVGPSGFYDQLADIIIGHALGGSELGVVHEFPWSLMLRESSVEASPPVALAAPCSTRPRRDTSRID